MIIFTFQSLFAQMSYDNHSKFQKLIISLYNIKYHKVLYAMIDISYPC